MIEKIFYCSRGNEAFPELWYSDLIDWKQNNNGELLYSVLKVAIKVEPWHIQPDFTLSA